MQNNKGYNKNKKSGTETLWMITWIGPYLTAMCWQGEKQRAQHAAQWGSQCSAGGCQRCSHIHTHRHQHTRAPDLRHAEAMFLMVIGATGSFWGILKTGRSVNMDVRTTPGASRNSQKQSFQPLKLSSAAFSLALFCFYLYICLFFSAAEHFSFGSR